jgi:CelD/BcsL family acetyltransferase involved in cellulose biosynthesis
MGWVFRNAYDHFDRYRSMWDALNQSRGNHVLLDSMFVGPLIRHFASKETLLGISDDDRNSGMVIMDKVRTGLWQTFQPAQAPLGLILLGNSDGASEQMAGLIRSLPGYSLGFSAMQQDPDFTAFGSLDHCQTAETLNYITTSRVTLAGSFEEYWKDRGRYYVDDLRRQSRRLDEQGVQLKFVADRDPDRVAEHIRDYGRLEGMGWKGREGTAVTSENQQGLFYREVMENFCSRGEGVVFKFLFNGKAVASDLCLERDGMMVVLKIAYDESLPGISPGKFIHREILRALFAEAKVKALEWYGRMHEWQTKLGSSARTMFHVNFYRNRWVPVVRGVLKRSLRFLKHEGQ